MLQFGLFGAGRIGRMHARNLAANPRVRLVSIYDVSAAAASAAAAECAAAAVDSAQAILGDSSIDAVFIASATDTHCDLIEQSVRAGKAVLCEKPIHLDLNRVNACREAVAGSGVPIQIGFNRRFDPSHLALQRAVRAGKIGTLEKLILTSRDPAPPGLDYLSVSGGLFRDMAIHDFDLARFVFGEEFVEVAAMGSVLVDARIGAIGDVDTAMITMKTASGALCCINCSRRCAYGYDQRVEAFGAQGMLVSTNPTPAHVERWSGSATAARPPLHHFFIERYADSYVAEVEAFVEAVEQGRQPSPAFEDGRRALILAEAAGESAKTGRAVSVSG